MSATVSQKSHTHTHTHTAAAAARAYSVYATSQMS